MKLDMKKVKDKMPKKSDDKLVNFKMDRTLHERLQQKLDQEPKKTTVTDFFTTCAEVYLESK